MALTAHEVNTLGGIVQQSWGVSSTQRSGSPIAVVKCRFLNDQRLIIEYTTVVNLLQASEMHARAKGLEEDGMKAVKDYVKGTKEQFKEAAGRALKLELISHHPSVEMISMSAYNPKKTAYFRVTAVAEYE